MNNTSVVQASPRCIQFEIDTPSDQVQRFIHAMEDAVTQLNPTAFEALPLEFPMVKEVGVFPFFKDVLLDIKRIKEKGLLSLSRSQGYCHNCLPNTAVNMFGSGTEKISFYYHFEAGDPVEIHTCTFCFDHKMNQGENSIDKITRIYSAKNRNPALVNRVLAFGNALKQNEFSEIEKYFDEDIDFISHTNQKELNGMHRVMLYIKRIANLHHTSGKKTTVELLFIGNNYEEHTDVHQYDGEPWLCVTVDDKKVLFYFQFKHLLFSSITVYSTDFVSIGSDLYGKVTYTGHYV